MPGYTSRKMSPQMKARIERQEKYEQQAAERLKVKPADLRKGQEHVEAVHVGKVRGLSGEYAVFHVTRKGAECFDWVEDKPRQWKYLVWDVVEYYPKATVCRTVRKHMRTYIAEEQEHNRRELDGFARDLEDNSLLPQARAMLAR